MTANAMQQANRRSGHGPFDHDPIMRQRRTSRAPAIGHFVREFMFADGSRPVLIDKRNIGFACPHKDHPETVTIIGFRGTGNPIPVACPYSEVKTWWTTQAPRGSDDAAD